MKEKECLKFSFPPSSLRSAAEALNWRDSSSAYSHWSRAADSTRPKRLCPVETALGAPFRLLCEASFLFLFGPLAFLSGSGFRSQAETPQVKHFSTLFLGGAGFSVSAKDLWHLGITHRLIISVNVFQAWQLRCVNLNSLNSPTSMLGLHILKLPRLENTT